MKKFYNLSLTGASSLLLVLMMLLAVPAVAQKKDKNEKAKNEKAEKNEKAKGTEEKADKPEKPKKPGKEEAVIKTSMQCKMCKANLETTLKKDPGILNQKYNLKEQTIAVTFNPEKTNLDKIRKAISKAGYDADEVTADPKAYKRLKDCCKKPEDRKPKPAAKAK